MRRGQSTLEYALLIGLAAVGLIVMLVYISRGHQGNLRSQADQLSAVQYAPGKTTIPGNRQSKILDSLSKAASSTTVLHGDMNEENTALETANANLAKAWVDVYPLFQEYEQLLAAQAWVGANAVRGGNFEWRPSEDCRDDHGQLISPPVSCENNTVNKINEKYADIGKYGKEANDAYDAWPERTQDTTISSGSTSSEVGDVIIDKDTSETLGDL